VRLLLRELLQSGRRASAALADRTSAGLQDMRSALSDGMRTGIFLPDLDLPQLMLSIQVLCVGHFTHQPIAKTLWKRDLADPKAREATLQHITALILRGICAPRTN
jgi:hypothetical protein